MSSVVHKQKSPQNNVVKQKDYIARVQREILSTFRIVLRLQPNGHQAYEEGIKTKFYNIHMENLHGCEF